jgi:hypothetical protein
VQWSLKVRALSTQFNEQAAKTAFYWRNIFLNIFDANDLKNQKLPITCSFVNTLGGNIG